MTMTDLTELLEELAEHDRRQNGRWTAGMHARVRAAIAEKKPDPPAEMGPCVRHGEEPRHPGRTGCAYLPGEPPVEIGTEHARMHNVNALEAHPHLHGTGPNQHDHSAPETVPRVGPTTPTAFDVFTAGARAAREISTPSEIRAWGVPVLTDAERRVVGLLAEAWNTLVTEVVEDGPTRDQDLAELGSHVHVVQNAVLAQAAARCYPALYRRMGGSLR